MDAVEVLRKSGTILMEQNDDLIAEREEVRKWITEVGLLLEVIPRSIEDISVVDSWTEYRKDIMIELKRLKNE